MEKPSDSQWRDNQELLEALNAAYDGPRDPEEVAALKYFLRRQAERLAAEATADEEWTLDSLIALVDEDNLHQEIETGPAVGNETW